MRRFRRWNSDWSKLNQISLEMLVSHSSRAMFLYIRFILGVVNRFYKISVFAVCKIRFLLVHLSIFVCCIYHQYSFEIVVTPLRPFLCQRSYSIITASLRPQLVILLQTITDVGCETTQDE